MYHFIDIAIRTFGSQIFRHWRQCMNQRTRKVKGLYNTVFLYVFDHLCGLPPIISLCFLLFMWFVISRGAEGPGREILQRSPSVCPSVTFSFRTVTQKRIDVFSRNFAGTCTMSWGCAV